MCPDPTGWRVKPLRSSLSGRMGLINSSTVGSSRYKNKIMIQHTSSCNELTVQYRTAWMFDSIPLTVQHNTLGASTLKAGLAIFSRNILSTFVEIHSLHPERNPWMIVFWLPACLRVFCEAVKLNSSRVCCLRSLLAFWGRGFRGEPEGTQMYLCTRASRNDGCHSTTLLLSCLKETLHLRAKEQNREHVYKEKEILKRGVKKSNNESWLILVGKVFNFFSENDN